MLLGRTKKTGTRRNPLWLVAGAVVMAVGLGGPAAWIQFVDSLGPLTLPTKTQWSAIAVDRDGHLLRAFTTRKGRWRLPATSSDVDPRFLAMLKTYEDTRFDHHSGVDWLAMVRAATQFVSNGRIVSGGSTLTMQVARLLEPRNNRTINTKLRQIARAWQLEDQFSKREILDLYLALAPYGGNLEGIRAATLAYFGKEPKRLSIAEQALLVALPQSPETRRPDRHTSVAKRARNRVLERMQQAGLFRIEEMRRSIAARIPDKRKKFPALAAHMTEKMHRANPKQLRFRFTYQRRLQRELEQLVKDHARKIGPQVSGAVIVIDNSNGHVRARVGSADYFSKRRAGANDMTRALRSPGSALKPFIYAMAFENGIAHPETVLEDRKKRYGHYAPENFDLTYHGQVTARTALQHSLNVPAVAVLNAVGPDRFLARLKNAGAQIKIPDTSPAGLALALGGLGTTLEDLAKLYSGLARRGRVPNLTEVFAANKRISAAERQISTAVASWYVADILRGAPPPENVSAGLIAFKTGTSYGYRDAIAVGYDRNFTVAIWFGRADNGAVPGMVARKFAAPALFEAFARVGGTRRPLSRPANVLIARSSQLPPPLRHLRKDAPKILKATRTGQLKIAYPPDGSRVDLGLSGQSGPDNAIGTQLALKVEGGSAPFRWIINGAPAGPARLRRQATWRPDGPGFARVSVIDSKGNSSSVRVRLE